MKRTIKSYVLRAGRMTTRQREGWEIHYPRYALTVGEGLWNFEQIFGRQAPTILEIGFGMGKSLCEMARANPENNYIGVEVHQAGVGALAADLAEAEQSNVRIIAHDAVDILTRCIADGSLAGVQIFFPDPWPKKKHHKRRLVQTAFIEKLFAKLSSEGFIHCATDWQEYAEHMLDVLSVQPGIHNASLDRGYVPRPEHRPLTKFETRGQRLGHGVWDLMFIKDA